MVFYLGGMAYEYFLVLPTVAAFEGRFETLAADAAEEFPGDSTVLRLNRDWWLARVLGRETVQAATHERSLLTPWQDLRSEFDRLDGADVRATIRRHGWWALTGGPSDLREATSLQTILLRLARRAAAALGVYDRTTADSVWLDLLARESRHSSGLTIKHLSVASADYCRLLAKQRSEAIREGAAGTAVLAQSDCIFQRNDGLWTARYAAKQVVLPDRLGLKYIAELLRRPGVAIQASALTGGERESVGLVPLLNMPMADAETIKSVRKELVMRQDELLRLPENHWARRGELNDEIAKLQSYLGQVQTNRGRPRNVSGGAEHSRTSVTNAIVRAIEHISKAHPDLGQHLRESIKTGTAMLYAPADPPDWHL
jgi:hypothetical protein